MKISVLGYSGSGKSTLAELLGKRYDAAVLHLDTVHFLPNWAERGRSEKLNIVEGFMRDNEDWVIDGNYSALCFDERTEQADLIVLLLFDRFACLRRVISRYRKYKNTTRPDMAEGYPEKLDAAFIAWVLHGGRTKSKRARYDDLCRKYGDKVIVIKNQRQLDKFCEKHDAARR